jgi:hypothetical protein
MEVSDLEQETQDLDWFALDEEGTIGHFATGGSGKLPRSVAASRDNMNMLTEFFRTHFANFTTPIINPKLGLHVSLKDEDAKEKYLQDYLNMASRGLYSYDCLLTGKKPTGYFLVAQPTTPLQLTLLPREIRSLLEMTVLQASFRKSDEITVGMIE